MSSRARPLPHSASLAAQQSVIEAANASSSGGQQGPIPSFASARNHDSLSRNLQQLALQSSKPDTSYSPGIGRRTVKIASSTFQKPSPGFRTRTLNNKAGEAAALFPKFHYLPSLGLGVGSNIDNSGKATSAFIGGDQQYMFISGDSPLQQGAHKLSGVGVGPSGALPEHAVTTAGGGRWIHPVMGHMGLGLTGGGAGVSGPGAAGIPSVLSTGGASPIHMATNSSDGETSSGAGSKSASPASTTHTLQHQNIMRMSGGGGAGAGFSPGGLPGSGPSPGVGVRRLAEQFLNSITDDSPAVRPRRIGLGKNATTVVTPSAHVPTLPSELAKGAVKSATAAAAATKAAGTDTAAGATGGEDTVPSKDAAAGGVRSTPASSRATPDPSSVSPPALNTSASPSPAAPQTPLSPASASEEWQQLHDDIKKFSDGCAADSASQKRLREELVQRTQWSIRCVWPTAHVDLVGSVAAGVCLPRSDLDFVIRFPPSATPPPSYSYATATQNSAQQALQQGSQTAQQQAQYNSYATTSSNTAATSASGSSATSPTSASVSAEGATSPEGSPQLVQHFAQAGQLIKLIGGRKKSKLLFRSTKIQVFKDINLIRLRDGCSGISMDLWFPVDPQMLTRSQQHTLLIHKMLADFPLTFYPLAIVLKSFMAQNLLNSGYSGLGSYGVLLMLIRFLQWERYHAAREGRAEERNLGKLLVSFFRLYATFDYIHHAIDVVNIGEDGGFTPKPEVLIVFPSRKPVQAGGAGGAGGPGARKGRKKGGDDDSDDEDDAPQYQQQQQHQDDVPTEEPLDVAGAGGGAPLERESASLKKKRSNATDRFTLLILDPMDSKNQIICHHKALRNMIGAFIRAIMILDPDHPAPQLMLPPTPLLTGNAAAAAAAAAAAGDAASGVTPALTAVGPGVDASKAPAAAAAAAAAASSTTSSAPDTPLLVPQPIASLPQFPGLSATAGNTHASRFHRLIEVNAARLGPQTKPCTSAQCLNADGSSKTMCPIQNKVCFTCGHMFVKTATGGSVSAPPGAGQQQGTASGNGQQQSHHQQQQQQHARGPKHGPGMGAHQQQQQQQHGGRHQNPPSHGFAHPHQQQHQQLSMQQQMPQQHRAPPMQGQHARNYIGRQQQQQQQQHSMPMSSMQPQSQQQQQLFNAQTLLAAQQILAAQQLASHAALSQHQAAAAAAATPLMFFNLQTQQVELVPGAASMPSAPLGFIPVMGWPGQQMGAPGPGAGANGAQPPPGMMYGPGPATANAGMDQAAQLANLQAMMVGLQQQQQAQAAGAQMFGYPQAVTAAAAAAANQQQQLLQQYLQMQAHPLYSQSGSVSPSPDMAYQLAAAAAQAAPGTYSPQLSYDGLSPQFQTRSLSDAVHAAQMASDAIRSTPPSTPTRMRSNQPSPTLQMMQQAQQQVQQQQGSPNGVGAMQLMQQQQQQAMQLQAHLAAQAAAGHNGVANGGGRLNGNGGGPGGNGVGPLNGAGNGNGGGAPKPSSRSNRNFNSFNGGGGGGQQHSFPYPQ